MIKVILRLFRINLIFQVFLSFTCFMVIMGFVLSRLVYLQGLTASFSGTKPHLTVTFAKGSTQDADDLRSLLTLTRETIDVVAVSPFVKASRFLHIKSKNEGIFDVPEVAQIIEVTAIDFDTYPLAIPLEETRSLSLSMYSNPYTFKELAYALHHTQNAVVINQAMARVFCPIPEFVGAFAVSKNKSGDYLGEIHILSVMKDLEEIPHLFTSIQTAKRLLPSIEYNGIVVKLRQPEKLEEAQRRLKQKIEEKWGAGIFTIRNWKEEENKQKKVFEVFDALFWPIILVILLMSLFACILGIYRTFIVKQRSLRIIQNMGISNRQLFGLLAGCNTVALASGLLVSFSLVCLFADSFTAFFLEQLKQVVKVEQARISWRVLSRWEAGMFVIYLSLFLVFLWLIIREEKQPEWWQKVDFINRLTDRLRTIFPPRGINSVKKTALLNRPRIVSQMLFRDVTLLIFFGLGVGIIFGLGIAVGGNLFIHHTMDSYQRFVQRSLIGLKGSLVQEASPVMIESFIKKEKRKLEIPVSFVWNSPGPIRIELRQGRSRLKLQAQVVLLEKQYIIDKLKRQGGCDDIHDSNNMVFANSLLIRSLVGMNKRSPFTLRVKKWENSRQLIRFPLSEACHVDTGMMTDYPVLFMAWENTGLDPLRWREKAGLEFYTRDRAETEQWEKRLFRTMKAISVELSTKRGVSPDQLDVTPPKNLFGSDDMKLADSISRLTGYLSLLITAVTGFFAIVILVYGFSLLLELKRESLNTIQEMGMNHNDLAVGFLLRGLQIGCYAGITGILSAMLVRFLVESNRWIPYDRFFQPWNYSHFLLVLLLLPIFVGCFSGGVVWLILAQPFKIFAAQQQMKKPEHIVNHKH